MKPAMTKQKSDGAVKKALSEMSKLPLLVMSTSPPYYEH